jgi:hypothetical protein
VINVKTETLSFVELNSHADACTIGANCTVITYTEKTCNVTPYRPEYQALQEILIVQAATAYTNPETGETYILVINQELYMGDALPSTLLNPNQLCHHGMRYISCTTMHYPSIQELESCTWIESTSDAEWDPHSDDFVQLEVKTEEALNTIPSKNDRNICGIKTECPTNDNCYDCYTKQELCARLQKNIHISATG